MHAQHLLRKRSREWNVFLFGMVCALLTAAPASQTGIDISHARYAMALAVLQHQSVQTQDELASPQAWQKHLPYLMTALHHMATGVSPNQAAILSIKQTVCLPPNSFLYTKPLSSLPRIAVQRSGIPTTHFLN
jgi:hypothetical protein